MFLTLSGSKDFNEAKSGLRASISNETWSYETLSEFLADYQKFPEAFHISLSHKEYSMTIKCTYIPGFVNVSITAPTKDEVLKLFNQFDRNAKTLYIKQAVQEDKDNSNKHGDQSKIIRPIIFIGHGGDKQWKELNDYLKNQHNYEVITYETEKKPGLSTKEILVSILNKATFAILVFTAEDKLEDGTYNARQNVIHEAGLFQGKLSFTRAIMLLEKGTTEFSNIFGIDQIRFTKGDIQSAFSDVLSAIKSESEGEIFKEVSK
jgi:predicted nucleotide-binding protein